jgi:hypothetical protein
MSGSQGVDHDLNREIAGLSACLSQGKQPLGLLLGAGCPLAVRVAADNGSAPLIPDVAGLTQQVAAKCVDSELADAFSALAAGLRADLGREPNIEDLLSRLRSVRDLIGDAEFRGLTKPTVSELEEAIVGHIVEAVGVQLPTSDNPYHDLAVWLAATDRRQAPEIFTTNYDLLVEHALERGHLPYFDGFVGGESPFLDLRAIEEDEIPARWTRLWKLHGAINWALTPEGEVVRRRSEHADGQSLIHPSHLKYEQSRRMPYFVMQDRLRSFLRRPGAAIIIVGYSFGDEHINALIVDALRSNRTAAAFALQYSKFEDQPAPANLARSIPNLSVMAPDGAVVNSERGAWKNPSEDATGFSLGDFAAFGDLLRQLVGATRSAPADGDVVDDA